jgi:hypothetical protein
MQRQLLFLILILMTANLSYAQIDDEVIDDETVVTNNKNNEKLNNKKSKVKIDNLFLGTTFSFVFGQYLFVDFSPYVGYHIGKYAAAGIGATYIYSAFYPGAGIPPITDHVYGGRIFVNLRPFPELRGLKGLYAHVEGEFLNHAEVNNRQIVRKVVPAVNVGIGYNTAFDKGFAFTAELLVNALWFGQYAQGTPTVYNSPWQYRIGVYYAF